MNANAVRLVAVFLWAGSLVAAYRLGSRGSSPAVSETELQGNRPAVTLGAPSSTAASPTNSAAPSRKAPSEAEEGDSRSPALRVHEAIANARRELGGGGPMMFSPSAMFRAFGPLMELPQEEVKLAIAEVESSVDDPEKKGMLLSLLLGRWAEESPREALAYSEKMLEEQGPRAAQSTYTVVASWAQQDPDAAWEWYLDKRDSGKESPGAMGNDMHLHMIFRGMASKDIDKALSRISEIDDEQASRQAAFGIAGAATSSEQVRERILKKTSSMSPEMRDSLRQSVVSQWAPTDLEGAIDWMRTLPTDEREQLVNSSGFSLMFADPEKGAEFLLEDATEANLSRRYQTIVNGWANRDINAAGEWLNAQPPGPEQDDARSSFAMQVARRDPESAMEWAKSVQTDAQRFGAIRNVHRQWRKKDQDAADSALLNSGLPDDRIEEILKPHLPASGSPVSTRVP